MPKKRHKPEEIVAKLRQVDVLVSQGQSLADAVRSIGVTEVTYFSLFRCDGQRPPMFGTCANWELQRQQMRVLRLQEQQLLRQERQAAQAQMQAQSPEDQWYSMCGAKWPAVDGLRCHAPRSHHDLQASLEVERKLRRCVYLYATGPRNMYKTEAAQHRRERKERQYAACADSALEQR